MNKTILITVMCLLATVRPVVAGDWNQWLGGPERLNGASEFQGRSSDAPRFAAAWRVPLGSGYSATAVRGNDVATMMNDGKSDVVILLDARDGKERWRAKVGPRYKGHDGSIDGPLSTPALNSDSVYAISARGLLFCFDLDNGAQRWKKNLKSEFGATEPHYGFATSPLLVGDRLFVQAGGKGLLSKGKLVALDCTSGRILWKVDNELVDYTSPAAATMFGTPQIITQAPGRVVGLRQDDGTLLWELAIEQPGSWTPMVLQPDRVFVGTGGRSTMIRLAKTGERMEPKVAWRSPRLAGTINPVAYHNGVLYGNHNRRLTAVDAETGELLWVEKRDMFPLMVGNHLILLADREGKLVTAQPSRDAFRQLAEDTIYEVKRDVRVESPMALVDGMLFIRTDFAMFARKLVR